MRKLITLLAGLAVLVALSRPALAREVEYVSQHPVPHKFGGGFCYIDVPHVHNYGPTDPRMFRESHGQNYFVGDPAPFDYDGPRYSYYGAHPVAEAEMRLGHPVYCYIRGPHYHWYQPPPQAQFELTGGAYWYVGTYPPSYYDERPRYAVINEAYAPMPYARPVVDIQVAPVAVRAEISLGGPGWRATAVLGGPPAPVYYAPPPPSPVQIGVGINLGGPVIERREIIERREYIDERPPHWDHDHGRHEGWRNGDRGRHEVWHEGPRREERPRFEPPRQNPPSRFPPGRAVSREIPQRQPPSRAPVPHFAPRPAQGPAPHGGGPSAAPFRSQAQQQQGPSRGPAQPQRGPSRGPAPAQGNDQHRPPH